MAITQQTVGFRICPLYLIIGSISEEILKRDHIVKTLVKNRIRRLTGQARISIKNAFGFLVLSLYRCVKVIAYLSIFPGCPSQSTCYTGANWMTRLQDFCKNISCNSDGARILDTSLLHKITSLYRITGMWRPLSNGGQFLYWRNQKFRIVSNSKNFKKC